MRKQKKDAAERLTDAIHASVADMLAQNNAYAKRVVVEMQQQQQPTSTTTRQSRHHHPKPKPTATTLALPSFGIEALLQQNAFYAKQVAREELKKKQSKKRKRKTLRDNKSDKVVKRRKHNNSSDDDGQKSTATTTDVEDDDDDPLKIWEEQRLATTTGGGGNGGINASRNTTATQQLLLTSKSAPSAVTSGVVAVLPEQKQQQPIAIDKPMLDKIVAELAEDADEERLIQHYVRLQTGFLADDRLTSQVQEALKRVQQKLLDIHESTFHEAVMRVLEIRIQKQLWVWTRYDNGMEMAKAMYGSIAQESGLDNKMKRLNCLHADYVLQLSKLLRNYYVVACRYIPRDDDREQWNKRMGEIKAQLERTFRQAYVTYEIMNNDLCYQQGRLPDNHPRHFTEAILFSFKHTYAPALLSAHRGRKVNAHQDIMIYMIPYLQSSNFHYRDEYLYEELKSDSDHSTYYWEKKKKLSQYITDICSERTRELFIALTSTANVRDTVVTNLTRDEMSYLPWVKKERYVFSYRNGIYFLKENRFHRFEDGPISPPSTACRYFPSNFDERWVGSVKNNPQLVTDTHRINPRTGDKRQYFKPREGSEYGSWKDIETPLFDTLLKTQKFDKVEDLYDWIFVLCGRLLYDIGEFDHWEVMPFMLGYAGTGKSTLADIMQAFYEQDDVETVGNVTEIVFGLESFQDSFMNVAADINRKFTLDACTWKSITTGERVKINRKNKIAVSRYIPGSWLMVGNALPDWSEDAGSIARRLALLRWMVKVTNADTALKQKIFDKELPQLLVKMNRAYREMVTRVAEKTVHKVWPKYFNESVKKMQLQFNPLGNFIHSKDVFVDPHLDKIDPKKSKIYCREDTFKAAFMKYCKDPKNNIAMKQQWTREQYIEVFSLYNIKIWKASRNDIRSYPRKKNMLDHDPKPIGGISIIWGLDLTDNMDVDEDEDDTLVGTVDDEDSVVDTSNDAFDDNHHPSHDLVEGMDEDDEDKDDYSTMDLQDDDGGGDYEKLDTESGDEKDRQ